MRAAAHAAALLLGMAACALGGCSDGDVSAPVVPAPALPEPACDEGFADATGPFVRIADAFADSDPLTDRLCEEGSTPPGALENPWDLHCAMASGRGAGVIDAAPPPQTLRVVTWNIEFGTDLAGVLAMLDADPELAEADVLLLAEVDRGCPRSGGVDVARTIAEALRMDWVFGVEFVEHAQGGCEEGNAVLSRVPLGNARHAFHDSGGLERGALHAPYDWSLDADEPRTGRRSFVGADVRFGGGLLHVVASHLENRSSVEERGAEVSEIIADIDALPRRRAVIAGDHNVYPDIGDAVVDAPLFDALAGACFVNPHADMPQLERRTRPNLGYQIDFTWLRGIGFGDHGVQNALPERALPSDHYPVWVSIAERPAAP